MIEISAKLYNMYYDVEVVVGDTTVDMGFKDYQELRLICNSLEEFLLDVEYKTEREKELEKAIWEIQELVDDTLTSQEFDTESALNKILSISGEVL